MNNIPLDAENAEGIQRMDLSPIEISVVDLGDAELRFAETLTLIPEADEEERLYTVSNQDFNLEVFAYTRQELVEYINSDIAFLWKEYALAPDKRLSSSARELKRRLLKAISWTRKGVQ
jgi:hypothetical protein